MKEFFKATVEQCYPVSTDGNTFFLELSCPFIRQVKPGQFVLLEPLNPGSVMPRPFSVYRFRDGKLAIMFKRTGKNTEVYSRLSPGEEIEISGPYGKPFFVDLRKKHILVGGGMGAAGLMTIAGEFHGAEKSPVILLGVKCYKEAAGAEDFKEYGDVTSIAERGAKKAGLVTDLLAAELTKKKNKQAIVVACGPRGMLKKVAEMCAEAGNKCYVLLEEVMACGVGSCKGCAVFGKDDSVKHVCQDGPAFDAEWVDWEKFMPVPIRVLPKVSPPAEEPFKTVLEGNDSKSLILSHPTMNASGCLGIEQAENMDLTGVGALVTKGIKVSPTAGNRMPRVCETQAGMINSIGLEGSGIETFVSEELPRWLRLGRPVIANIAGGTVEEYVQLAKALAGTEVAAIKENVSCPNVKKGGMLFGVDAKSVYAVTKAVREAAPWKFLIVKLSPNVTDIAEIAGAAEDAGADAISLINTVLGMRIDPYTRWPLIGNVMGGLSGPAIKPIALRLVYQAAKRVKIPIIGIGGITNGADAAEFLMAGASAIAVGTALFKNPVAMAEIVRDLQKIMARHGANHVSDLVGSLIV